MNPDGTPNEAQLEVTPGAAEFISSFDVTSDPSAFKIVLFTNDNTKMGNYTITFETSVATYH